MARVGDVLVSAGNDWWDGQHLVDVAAKAVKKALEDLSVKDVRVEQLDRDRQNAEVGTVRLTTDGYGWLVSVTRLEAQ